MVNIFLNFGENFCKKSTLQYAYQFMKWFPNHFQNTKKTQYETPNRLKSYTKKKKMRIYELAR